MDSYKALTDQQLVSLLKTGDHVAFTRIYKKYWPVLYLHVYRMLQDEDMTSDVVQDTFSWFWQHAPLIEFTGSLSSYLYSAVRNKVFNLIRHEKVKMGYLKDITAYAAEEHYELEEEQRYKELLEEIESEIDKMPARMREIFQLSRKDLLTHKQIAAQLNIAESTVREQVKRALKQLKVKLKERPHLLSVFLHMLH